MPIEEIILKYKNKILREREILKSNDEPGSSKGSKSKSISMLKIIILDKEKNIVIAYIFFNCI